MALSLSLSLLSSLFSIFYKSPHHNWSGPLWRRRKNSLGLYGLHSWALGFFHSYMYPKLSTNVIFLAFSIKWIWLVCLAQKWLIFMVRLTWKEFFKRTPQNRKPQVPSSANAMPASKDVPSCICAGGDQGTQADDEQHPEGGQGRVYLRGPERGGHAGGGVDIHQPSSIM